MLASRARVCAAAVAGQAPARGNWLAHGGSSTAAFVACEGHVALCRLGLPAQRQPLTAAGPFAHPQELTVLETTPIAAHDRSRMSPIGGRTPTAAIQWLASVACRDELRLASVDTLGRVVLSAHPRSPETGAAAAEPSRAEELPQPPCRMPSWAQVVFDAADGSRLCVSHEGDRTLSVYHDFSLVQRITVSHLPSACVLLPVSEGAPHGRLVVAEASRLSLWDVATGNLIQSHEMQIPRIMSMEIDPRFTDTVLIAGDSRAVAQIDVRKFHRIGYWRSALKHEITRVLPCVSVPETCYAASGFGTELAAGGWAKKAAKVSRFESLLLFRSDARWVGLDRLPGTDILMGLTTSGHLYHLENVYKGTLPDPAAAPGDNSLQPNKDNVLAE